MATLKQRLHKKNSSGTYDTIHLETSASLVLMANGTTVEAAVNGKAASSHNHAASNITSGTLAVARGGTGVTSIDALRSALGVDNGSKIIHGTYTGTGHACSRGGNDFQPKVITIGFKAKLIIIYSIGAFLLACNGPSSVYNLGNLSFDSVQYGIKTMLSSPASLVLLPYNSSYAAVPLYVRFTDNTVDLLSHTTDPKLVWDEKNVVYNYIAMA